ncbi:TlpA disulfide reductase family protein [uncultured Bacteroides sp.]|uniref:TlpA disulfide reductase family protein n=1 Tax=uncultured Bacteroides sp. TaxID=162156 RepID=UPI002AAADD81|nr:TlpA disulfide reductase family protein [uncultured Bacteroides sp.]
MRTIKTLLLALLIPSLGMAQNTYLLKCKVGNLNSPAKAYLMYFQNQVQVLDSATITNGAFEFKGSVDAPTEAYIRINHDGTPDNPTIKPKYDLIAFLIENKTISINSNDSIAKASVTGSELNSENKIITAKLKPLIEKYNGLNQEYESQSPEKQNSKAYIEDLESRAKAITDEVTNIKLEYANTHPDSYLSIMLLNSTLKPGFDAIEADKIFSKLSPTIKESELGKTVENVIAETKRTQIGIQAPDFAQNDVENKTVKLSDFRGKYVLLDFWASWCAPCRRENPNLKATYIKYNNKGFEILGVSLDKADAKGAWVTAIAKDQLTWTQVSDLKGWDNEAAVLYSVKAIPTNFLIDPKGYIIAKGLRGEALNEKLAEIFK